MQRGPSRENFILFFVLLGATVRLVVVAAILIGYFCAQPKPAFGESRVDEIVVYREAGQPAVPAHWDARRAPNPVAFLG